MEWQAETLIRLTNEDFHRLNVVRPLPSCKNWITHSSKLQCTFSFFVFFYITFQQLNAFLFSLHSAFAVYFITPFNCQLPTTSETNYEPTQLFIFVTNRPNWLDVSLTCICINYEAKLINAYLLVETELKQRGKTNKLKAQVKRTPRISSHFEVKFFVVPLHMWQFFSTVLCVYTLFSRVFDLF